MARDCRLLGQSGSGALLRAVVAGAGCLLSACTGPGPADPPRDYYGDALRAARSEDFEDAEREAKLAIQLDPLDARAHFLLATLLARRGEMDLAIVGYRRVLTLEPAHAEALYNLGTLLLQRDEPVAAAEVLEQALEVRPDHVPTYNNLGNAWFRAGLPELAGAAFEEALQRDPESEVALKNLALLAEAAGDRAAAAEYRESLERARQNREERP